MKKVEIVLVTPDETFEVQTKIVNNLIEEGLIQQREVTNVSEEGISLELENFMTSPKVKTIILRKYRPYIALNQSKFDDGEVDAGTSERVTSGSQENVSTSDQDGEGARSGIVVGVGEGMGNANLKGTTFIAGNDKKRSRVNLDEIVRDQNQYTATDCPKITYAEGGSTLYLPVTQTSYSVGIMTKSDVTFMNKKFEQQQAVFASELPENKGTIVPPVASPDDVKVEHNMEPGAPKPDESRIIPDSELSELNDNRSKDARDPDFSPALVNTKAELIAIIRKGQMPNQTQVQEGILPILKRIDEKVTPKDELIQRLLAFNERFGLDQMAYSVTSAIGGYMAKRSATKLIQQTAANKAEEHLGPGTGKYASGAIKPVAKAAGTQVGNVAKKLLN